MTSPDPTFALPGQWWRIPVQDPEASTASIRAYVETSMSRADDQAHVRAKVREEMTRAADEARAAHGREMYVTGEIAPGVPLSINLTTYRPELPPRFSSTVAVDVSAESFASTLRAREGDVDVDVWAEGDVAVVRDLRSQVLADDEGNEERALRLDYWLFHAGTTETPLLSFSSPVVWEEAMESVIDLIDAIVGTVEWDPPVLTASNAE